MCVCVCWVSSFSHAIFRHIYQPLLDSGASRTLAMSVVFIVSAFFHEVSAPRTPCSLTLLVALDVFVSLKFANYNVPVNENVPSAGTEKVDRISK